MNHANSSIHSSHGGQQSLSLFGIPGCHPRFQSADVVPSRGEALCRREAAERVASAGVRRLLDHAFGRSPQAPADEDTRRDDALFADEAADSYSFYAAAAAVGGTWAQLAEVA